MKLDSKIFVAGGSGMVGSAIIQHLQLKGYKNIVSNYFTHHPHQNQTQNISFRQVDLTSMQEVEKFFSYEKPEYVFLAAAKAGGIMSNNTYRADFIFTNLAIQTNVIHSSWCYGVKKLLFLGSSCIYPRDCPQPMREDYLLSSPLEYTNEPYAIAKIAGIKMCESYNIQYGTNFIAVMPTNLYGPNDNYDFHNSHVIPAVIRKMHCGKLLMRRDDSALKTELGVKSIESARDLLSKHGISDSSITLWGTGKAKREFMYAPDMADACVYVMEHLDFVDLALGITQIRNTHINIGVSEEISIKDLSYLIKNIVDYEGIILWDTSKPDGPLSKLLDVSKLKLMGWQHSMPLEKGIKLTYKSFMREHGS